MNWRECSYAHPSSEQQAPKGAQPVTLIVYVLSYYLLGVATYVGGSKRISC